MIVTNNTAMIKANSSAQDGFTLLEILVTVFVLAIGLLGIAGMQATSITLSHESHLRSQASLLAVDMADRMRSNRDSAIADGYNGTYTGTGTLNNGCNAASGATCTAAQITTIDLNNWDFKLGQTFPGVQAIISTNVVNGQTIGTITLIWVDTETDEAVDGANAANRTFSLRTII